MFAPKNILVPTDFSKYSDASLQKAVDIAIQYEAKIYLLHVITQHIQQCAVDYCLTAQLVNQLEKESIKGAEDKLKKEANALAKKKGVKLYYEPSIVIWHKNSQSTGGSGSQIHLKYQKLPCGGWNDLGSEIQ